VTTDITNYYDNIGFEELRRVIAAAAPTAEVLLDLLFTLIQDLAWSPDYLPRTLRGLPVINIESPSLTVSITLWHYARVFIERMNNHAQAFGV